MKMGCGEEKQVDEGSGEAFCPFFVLCGVHFAERQSDPFQFGTV